MSIKDDFRKVGSIAKPHGIRGEFNVHLESDFPDWVAERSQLYVEKAGEMVAHKVISSRLRPNKLIMALEGFPSRTEVEASIGVELYVSDDEARDLLEDPDFFYNSDLVGLEVIREKNSESQGKVISVVEMPAQNLLEIEREDGKVFLFPFTKPLIRDIDLEKGLITVLLPEGLIEANDPESQDEPDSSDSDAD